MEYHRSVSHDLSPRVLYEGYCRGWFPMGDESGEIDWHQPHVRALFPLSGMRVSQRLARRMDRGGFRVSFDEAFEQVMRGCLRPDENWITEELIRAMTECHQMGWAHSCEVWVGDDLVGGVYGLALGGVFCAESMFHRKTDMSKIALKSLIDQCRALGFQTFDAQVMSPHLETLGAFPVTQEEYLRDHLQPYLSVQTDWSR